jgi:hypothetical protein
MKISDRLQTTSATSKHVAIGARRVTVTPGEIGSIAHSRPAADQDRALPQGFDVGANWQTAENAS